MVVASTVQKVRLRGRDDDLAAATALLGAATDGRGGALVLTGPPGIGRTALLNALADTAVNPLSTVSASGPAGTQTVTASASGPAATQTVTASASGPAGTATGGSVTVLSVTGCHAESALPLAGLHRLLAGLPYPAGAHGPAHGEPPLDRLAAGLAVLAALRDAARAGPVLVLVDDAHALDRASLDALAVAARRAGGERIALVFALRDTPGAAAVEAALAGLPRRRLGLLDPRDSRSLLAGAVPGLAGDVAGVLAGRAAGNPRALTELAAALSAEQRRGEAAPPTTPPRDGPLSREYRAVLRTLPPDTRRVLVLAAAAARTSAAGTSCPAALLPAADLAPAEHAELVHVEDGRARFVPPLLAEVVYAEAGLADRLTAHRRLASLVADRREAALHRAATATGPDDALAAELAAAALAADGADTALTADGADTALTADGAGAALTAGGADGTRASDGADGTLAADGADTAAVAALQRAAELTADPARAAAWTLGAARLAWRGGEPHRARLLLRAVFPPVVPQALHAERELLLGEVELRTGAHGDARHTLLAAAARLPGRRALRALALAGEALGASGRHDEFAAVARRALALRPGPGPAPDEAPDETPDEAVLFEHVAGMAAGYAGDPARAAAPLRRAVALAAACADPPVLVRAAWAGIVAGRDEDAHRLAVRAARLARGVGDRATEPLAQEAAATAALALGDLDLAAATAAEGLRLAAATGQDAVADNCCGLLAVIAGMLGDADGCRRWVRRCRARAGGDIDSQARAMCVWAASLVDVAEGRHADAAGRLWGVMRTAVGRGHLGVQVPAIPTLVEAVVRGGDPGPAREVLAAYDVWAAATANPTWLALSARCHGLLAAGDDEADERFREALRLHLAGDSAFPGARTELLYGEELRRRRRPAAAREHLRSALATFERYEAGPWTRRAAAELRAAGDHVEPAPAEAPALTAQQARIARLVAGGATNREIAAALFVSPRTVEHHLRNIFVRLGVRSRTELARVLP
ncbi:LuxR C-terminal-related transcriptional regulator [Dactylosporangium sp. NPDC000244]|uniref:helix-turn-helix transcriptional regulator n=1 Tax=Dactylosporangium sp. NPDC000244 TaxID=3154365 RepID=UPI003324FB76